MVMSLEERVEYLEAFVRVLSRVLGFDVDIGISKGYAELTNIPELDNLNAWLSRTCDIEDAKILKK